MNPDQVAAYALSFAEVSEEQPFGPGTDVYKVAGKIFAILSPERVPPIVSLKCEPDLALELRAQHETVIPGYHLNKKHWNSVILDDTVPVDEVQDMIRHSYERVVASSPKAIRVRLSTS